MSDISGEAGELVAIRKLLILGLVKLGVTTDDIGGALGMHRTTIARMFPKGLLTDVGKKA